MIFRCYAILFMGFLPSIASSLLADYTVSCIREDYDEPDCEAINLVILAQIRQCVEDGTGQIARAAHRDNGNGGNANGNGNSGNANGNGQSLRSLESEAYTYCKSTGAECKDFLGDGKCCRLHNAYCTTSKCNLCGCARRRLGFLEDPTTRKLTQQERSDITNRCRGVMRSFAQELRDNGNNCLGTPSALEVVALVYD
jgi:hypothetical protein